MVSCCQQLDMSETSFVVHEKDTSHASLHVSPRQGYGARSPNHRVGKGIRNISTGAIRSGG